MQTQTIAATRRPVCDLVQRAVLAPLVRRYFRLTVRSTTDLAALPTPCIFAANHSSHLDSLAILAALPEAVRARTRVAAAEDYWYRSPLRRLAAAMCGAFPFPRKGYGGVARGAALLDAGCSVLLYPAGTREQGNGFRRGVGVLAGTTGRPVVPVAVAGSGAILPKGRHLPRRGTLTLTFGAPLAVAPDSSPDEATAAIAAAVGALLDTRAGDEAFAGPRFVIDTALLSAQAGDEPPQHRGRREVTGLPSAGALAARPQTGD